MADWHALRDPLYPDGVPAEYAGALRRERCDRCGRRDTHVLRLPRAGERGLRGLETVCQRCYYRPPDGPPHTQGRLFGGDDTDIDTTGGAG